MTTGVGGGGLEAEERRRMIGSAPVACSASTMDASAMNERTLRWMREMDVAGEGRCEAKLLVLPPS